MINITCIIPWAVVDCAREAQLNSATHWGKVDAFQCHECLRSMRNHFIVEMLQLFIYLFISDFIDFSYLTELNWIDKLSTILEEETFDFLQQKICTCQKFIGSNCEICHHNHLLWGSIARLRPGGRTELLKYAPFMNLQRENRKIAGDVHDWSLEIKYLKMSDYEHKL